VENLQFGILNLGVSGFFLAILARDISFSSPSRPQH
jgi:hypothetical protein